MTTMRRGAGTDPGPGGAVSWPQERQTGSLRCAAFRFAPQVPHPLGLDTAATRCLATIRAAAHQRYTSLIAFQLPRRPVEMELGTVADASAFWVTWGQSIAVGE
jgi:hypothetical protein